jgi:chromosome segregation ATPase
VTTPATQQEVIQLMNMLRALEQKVSGLTANVNSTADVVKRLSSELSAAVQAISEEKVESESKYNHDIMRSLDEIKQDIHSLHHHLKHTLEAIELSTQNISRNLDQPKPTGQRRVFG